MKLRSHLIIIVLALKGVCATAQEVSCVHFYKDKQTQQELPSQIPVGQDVGKLNGSIEGSYICKIQITESHLENGDYLYLGEVGDASYLKIEGVNTPYYHGWNPNQNIFRYLRFLPFFVNLRNISNTPGLKTVHVYYRDLIPGQVGIRSGTPLITDLRGLVKKSLYDLKGIWLILLQVLLLCFVFMITAIDRTSTIKERAIMVSTLALVAASLFFVTSIPRYFIESHQTIRLVSNLTNFFGCFALYFPFTHIFQSHRRYPFLTWVRWGVLMSIGLYTLIYSTGNEFYRTFLFAMVIFLTMVIIPTHLSFKIYFSKIHENIFLKNTKSSCYLMFFFTACAAFDTWNYALNDLGFPYFLSHYLVFTPACIWQYSLLQSRNSGDYRFIRNLEKLKASLLNTYNKAGNIITIETAIDQIRLHLRSNQAAILVQHEKEEKNNPVILGAESVESKSMIGPSATLHFTCNLGSTFIRIQFSCFDPEINPHFFERHHSSIQQLLDFILRLAYTAQDNHNLTKVLLSARLHIHPIHLKSEKYFLENFRSSENINAPVYIMGDLVDSSLLNRVYGAGRINSILNESLDILFEKTKHLGLILSKRNGDEIDIILPNLHEEGHSTQALERGLDAVTTLLVDNPFEQIRLKESLAMKIRFKWVIIQGSAKTVEHQYSASQSFSTLADSSIDLGSRVLSKVALGDECILVGAENIGTIRMAKSLIPMPAQRFKGISESQNLFFTNPELLKKNIA